MICSAAASNVTSTPAQNYKKSGLSSTTSCLHFSRRPARLHIPAARLYIPAGRLHIRAGRTEKTWKEDGACV